VIPTITMCVLMDLPTDERAQFLKWNLETLGGADFTGDTALKAYGEMHEYWRGIVEERRRNPGSDLISQILTVDVKGGDLEEAEVAGFCSLLHDASQNTTMNMIAQSILALARHPDQMARLREQPELWATGVEELFRYVSPVQGWLGRPRATSKSPARSYPRVTKCLCCTGQPITIQTNSRTPKDLM